MQCRIYEYAVDTTDFESQIIHLTKIDSCAMISATEITAHGTALKLRRNDAVFSFLSSWMARE
jgi:hypothetical protein